MKVQIKETFTNYHYSDFYNFRDMYKIILFLDISQYDGHMDLTDYMYVFW